ncbi:MAG: hypothetical protein ACE5HM_01120 [Acidiferrobacterales bacterium]
MQKQSNQVGPEYTRQFVQPPVEARGAGNAGTKYFVNAQSSAYHEAGHAVVAWYHNINLEVITLGAAEDEIGRTRHVDPLQGVDTAWGPTVADRIRMEQLVSVCLAGPLAQRKFSLVGFRRAHAEDDWQQAVDLLSYFVVTHEELEAYFRLLEVQTRNLLDLDFIWKSITNLATVLLEYQTLSGAEANRIIQEPMT